jgi:hypothetical protein
MIEAGRGSPTRLLCDHSVNRAAATRPCSDAVDRMDTDWRRDLNYLITRRDRMLRQSGRISRGSKPCRLNMVYER